MLPKTGFYLIKIKSVSAHVQMRCDTPYYWAHFGWNPPSPYQMRLYIIDGPFLNQETCKEIRICIHWNIIIRKHKFLYEKINIQESSINKKSNKKMLLILCTWAAFIKIKSCLVARIVSFDNKGLHLLFYRILEQYPFKDIETDISHVVSH